MPRVAQVKRCVRVDHNPHGRDLVVGDLHGHRGLLEQALERMRFDPARDRVFSVGDLVDRGPDSLATLSLLEEPWFNAVLGNHELMLLKYLGFYDSRLHARKAYTGGPGEWIGEALCKRRKLVDKLADRVAALPLSLQVASTIPFNVMHGDLRPFEGRLSGLLRDDTVCVHLADRSTSSRSNFGEAQQSKLVGLQYVQHLVQVSDLPLGILPMTYVGHSPVRQITVHNSYVYIDQGVCARSVKHAPHMALTLLDHTQFAYWLGGVATALQASRVARDAGTTLAAGPRSVIA